MLQRPAIWRYRQRRHDRNPDPQAEVITLTGAATALQLLVATITIGGSGRVGPTVAAMIGLTGTVTGALALARFKRRAPASTDIPSADGNVRAAATVALGVISLVLGGLFLAAADGGPGTGNGVVGSAAAIVLGPIAISLGVAQCWLSRTSASQGTAARAAESASSAVGNTRPE